MYIDTDFQIFTFNDHILVYLTRIYKDEPGSHLGFAIHPLLLKLYSLKDCAVNSNLFQVIFVYLIKLS